jgi:hypothetical protein
MIPCDLAHSTVGSTALVLLNQPHDGGRDGCRRLWPECFNGGLEGDASTTTNLVDNGRLDDATDARGHSSNEGRTDSGILDAVTDGVYDDTARRELDGRRIVRNDGFFDCWSLLLSMLHSSDGSITLVLC